MHASFGKECFQSLQYFCSVFVCYTEVKKNSIVHKFNYYYSRHVYNYNTYYQLIINCLDPHPAHTSLARMGACVHACSQTVSSLICINVCFLALTLGLSLFYKNLPISNTGDSIAYILATIHFLYPKVGSFSDMEYQLAYRDSKVPKHFVVLNQMQCSPSFDWNCGKQNDHTACWYQLHP